jgi:hypothetical protein
MSEGIIALHELGQYMREHGGEKGECLFERFMEVLGKLVHAYALVSTAERMDGARVNEYIGVLRACAGKIRLEFPDMPCIYMFDHAVERFVIPLIGLYRRAVENGMDALSEEFSADSSFAPEAKQPERADAPTGEGAGS